MAELVGMEVSNVGDKVKVVTNDYASMFGNTVIMNVHKSYIAELNHRTTIDDEGNTIPYMEVLKPDGRHYDVFFGMIKTVDGIVPTDFQHMYSMVEAIL